MISGIKKYISLIVIIILMVNGCKDKEVFTGVEVAEDLPTGKIFVESTPPGALIFLDGKNMGVTTPAILPYLSPKQYLIKLRKNLYPDTTFKMIVFDGQTTNLFFNYNTRRFLGEINVVSTPTNASIFLNDSATARITPYIFADKTPGEYKVKLTFPEHRADSIRITVRGSQRSTASIILEDTTQWVSYQYRNSGIGSNSIKCVEVDHQGYVWLGSSNIGPIRFNGKVFEIMGYNYNELIRKNISDIKVDKDGAIWCASESALYKYYNDSWTKYEVTSQGSINSISINNSGVVWGATSGNGIFKLEGGAIQYFNSATVSQSIFPSNNIYDITVDKVTGKVWLTMMGGYGVKSYDGSKWETYTITDMKLDPSIGNFSTKINIDNKGILWVSFSPVPNLGARGGVVFYNNNQWTYVSIPGFGLDKIKRISFSGDYNFFSSSFGIAMFKGVLENPIIFNRYNSKIPADAVEDMTIDKSGNLWFVTYNGTMKLKKGNF